MNLHEAIKNGNTEAAINLINDGADIHAVDRYGSTALHNAASHGHTDVFNLLIYRGSDIHVVNKSGSTALHNAASHGHTDAVNSLLDRGADIEAGDVYGHTPLHWAAMIGSTIGITILIDRGADIQATDNNGRTAVYLAAANGRSESVRILMHRGADIEVRDKDGYTPLHKAVYYNDMNKNILICGVKFAYLECIKHLTNESTKEFIENSTPNKQLGEYIKEQYLIATSETNEKSESLENDENSLIRVSMINCAKAIFGMETTLKAKALLKIKIGSLRSGVKDAYVMTLKFLHVFTKFNLLAENINHIIGFVGLYDAPVDLNDILSDLDPKLSRSILGECRTPLALNQCGTDIKSVDSTNFCTIS